MKLLVTGGAGFIGSNFIRHILAGHPDYKIINFDKLTYAGNLENLRGIEDNPNYSFIKGDIADEEAVENVIGKVDVIVNFAAETHVDRSILEADSFAKTNFYGTYVLLEAARKNGIEKMIQISTDEVYGSIEKGSFKETCALGPNSPYAATKAGADMLAKSYFTTYGIPVIITRSSNNFGSYQYPEKLIPLFVTNALDDKPLPLYGDGMNVRDWLSVEDNCQAIEFILHRGKAGEAYNVGGGNELTNLELTGLILELLNKPEDLIKRVKDRPGHDRRYSLDCSKLKAELGWKPQSDFRQALKKTIKWYQDNRGWWEKIKKKKEEFKTYYAQQYDSR